ncbi:hypothetical protein scyTo_0026809 [Scyliorhinus torazame]|uniref:Uncharacterized protein n=1 Tax=Scyliorhinus torazame TaxID=75743 RepID=A0A401QL57_SCYTO|nr:hypothetical protein [Scyliorhinus torazame]
MLKPTSILPPVLRVGFADLQQWFEVPVGVGEAGVSVREHSAGPRPGQRFANSAGPDSQAVAQGSECAPPDGASAGERSDNAGRAAREAGPEGGPEGGPEPGPEPGRWSGSVCWAGQSGSGPAGGAEAGRWRGSSVAADVDVESAAVGGQTDAGDVSAAVTESAAGVLTDEAESVHKLQEEKPRFRK